VIDYEPRTCSLYLGSMKKAQRDEATKAQIIVATYGMAYEALDIPRLDTLVMLTPRSEIEQPCGRIMRPHPSKKTPLIIDLVDPFSLFRGFSFKHFSYFRELGYAISTLSAEKAADVGAVDAATYLSESRFKATSTQAAPAVATTSSPLASQPSILEAFQRASAAKPSVRLDIPVFDQAAIDALRRG
jgi:hypothetical protein